MASAVAAQQDAEDNLRSLSAISPLDSDARHENTPYATANDVTWPLPRYEAEARRRPAAARHGVGRVPQTQATHTRIHQGSLVSAGLRPLGARANARPIVDVMSEHRAFDLRPRRSVFVILRALRGANRPNTTRARMIERQTSSTPRV